MKTNFFTYGMPELKKILIDAGYSVSVFKNAEHPINKYRQSIFVHIQRLTIIINYDLQKIYLTSGCGVNALQPLKLRNLIELNLFLDEFDDVPDTNEN